MEIVPTFIPFRDMVWYGPWCVFLLLVMVQVLILLLREHMLPAQQHQHGVRHRYVPHDQHYVLLYDVYEALHRTHTTLSDVEQRLRMIEQMAEEDRATLADVRDRLATRSRSSSRKTVREEQ